MILTESKKVETLIDIYAMFCMAAFKDQMKEKAIEGDIDAIQEYMIQKGLKIRLMQTPNTIELFFEKHDVDGIFFLHQFKITQEMQKPL